MSLADFFLAPADYPKVPPGRSRPYLDEAEGGYLFDPTTDNLVRILEADSDLFDAILSDLRLASGPDDFAYFANWWLDLDVPLGDPDGRVIPPNARRVVPPPLRAVLTSLAAGPPGPIRPDRAGPQLCCMVWDHKQQADFSGPAILPFLLPGQPAGGPPIGGNQGTITGVINRAAARFFTANLGTRDRGILDGAHRSFGSHHQKLAVIRHGPDLVAYIGSFDFNADRLYAVGDRRPRNPSTTKGSPLNDVSVRVEGPAAVDGLRTFVDRWQAHAEGKDFPLIGASHAPVSSGGPGDGIAAQVTHTYGRGYPFPTGIATAADARLKIIRTARRYVYFEDQYLIGSPELGEALAAKLRSNAEILVIGVMTAESISDMPWRDQRRGEFWRPLHRAYPNQVHLFEMLAPDGTDTGPGAYLHNKMTIADDEVATVGSVNFSQRSSTHDTEVMITLGGPGPATAPALPIALEIRLRRWSRHLARPRSELARLDDALALWRRPTLPPSALVRRWVPALVSYWPRIEDYLLHRSAFDTVIDPA